MSIGSNKYNPCSVLTSDNMTHSQFLTHILFLNFGHDVTMMISFELPCDLCLVDAVFMLTRNSVIFHLNDSCRSQSHVGFTFTITSCILGVILNLCLCFLFWSKCSSCGISVSWALSWLYVAFLHDVKLALKWLNFFWVICQLNILPFCLLC